MIDRKNSWKKKYFIINKRYVHIEKTIQMSYENVVKFN